MVQRPSLIFAASLAVLSILEPTFGFAAAAPAQQHDGVEKPRFLRREVKRQFLNVSTSLGPADFRGPFGGQSSSESSSNLQSLTDTLSIPPAETTEATTSAPALTQTPPDTQSIQSQISQSLLALEASLSQSLNLPSTSALPATSIPITSQEIQPTTSAAPTTSQSVNSDTNRAATVTTTTAVSATLPPVDSNTSGAATEATTNSAPATSPSVNTNTNGAATESTTITAPATSSTGGTATEGATAQTTTTAAGNTQTSAAILPDITSSSQLPQTKTPTTQSTKQSDSIPARGSSLSLPSVPTAGPTSASSEQTTAGTSQVRDTSAPVIATNSLSSSENGGILQSSPGSQVSATIGSLATEASSELQNLPTASNIPPITESSGIQQTPPTVTPETSPRAETIPTTGITARSASSPSSEARTTNAGLPSQTHSTSVQTLPTLSVPNVIQSTKASATEQSQPSVIQSTKASATEQSQPDVIQSTKASATEQSQSNIIQSTKASATEQSQSNIIQSTKASATEQSQSNIIQSTKAGATEQSQPDVIQSTKASATEQSQPDVIQSTKASATEKSQPDVIQSTKASATEQSQSNIIQSTKAGATEQSQSSVIQSTKASATEQSQPDIIQSTKASATEKSQSNIIQSTKASATEKSQSNIIQSTKAGATEQSQSNGISAIVHSSTLPLSVPQQTNTNTGGQQTSPSTNAAGVTKPTGSQEQSSNTAKTSIPAVINTDQQPFTRPGQTESIPEAVSLSITTALPEATNKLPNANIITHSSAASIQLPSGDTVKSNSLSGIDLTTPAAQTKNPGTEAPANTKSIANAILPTLSASGFSSLSIGVGESRTNEAQPSASPSLPESASILPTVSNTRPPVTFGSGAISVPSTAVQQGTSNIGGVLPTSKLSATNALNTGNVEGSTPTGTELYSALTNALSATIGPGSSMLPNGVIVPTAQSVQGGNTASTQSGQRNSAQGQQSGASAIIPAASITLSSGSVVPNPLVSSPISQQRGAASVTLPGGSVILNPPASNPSVQQTGSPSVTLPGGSVVPNPLASSSAGTLLPSVTLPGGSIVPNPLASTSIGTVLPEGSGQSVVSNPLASSSAGIVLPSGTLPGGSIVPNPLASTSIGTVIPNPSSVSTADSGLSALTSNGAVISNPSASVAPITSNGVFLTPSLGADSTLASAVPAPITVHGGSVIQNPSATLSPSSVLLSNGQSAIVTPPVSATVSKGIGLETSAGSLDSNNVLSELSTLPGSMHAAISNSAQGSSSLPQASSTDANGFPVPIPLQSSAAVNTGTANTGGAQSNLPVSTGGPKSGSLQSGLSVKTGAVETGSPTLPSGSAVSGNVASPASGILSTGATSPIVLGSATNTNGDTVPLTGGQITGSSTLSGGVVVPLTASNPTAGTASGTPISSSGGFSSKTLSGGAVVSIASGTGSPITASAGQGTETAGQTRAGQTGISQIAASPTALGETTDASGTSATGVPQSESQPAPAPITGTATAPPNTPNKSPAQLSVATDSQKFPSGDKGPFTQQPTSYDTNTIQSVPTSILAQPSSALTSQSAISGPTGLPTGVPLVLYPPNGATKQPENTELIQIGFLYPLNYDFVWTHDESQKQIFKYLPMGIAWGLQIDIVNVTMQSLRAWDTTQDLHYITTLALAWVPSGQVQSLGLLVHTATSRFYHTPDPSTNTLLSMINIALPIAANSTDGGDRTSFGADPSSTSTMKDGGAPVDDNIGSSNPVRASSVGIAAGVACGAAAYGAAMFFVARRYRKRRQSHLRSPSMFSSPVMSHAGPDALAGAALMSGGVGDHRSPSPYHDEDLRAASRGSGRSASTGRQQISAPVMAENSLGWN